MPLAVEDPLLAALDLRELAVDLLLLRDDPLLDLGDFGALVPELVLDFGAELDRLLARLDLSLAAHGFRVPDGIRGDALALGLGRRGAA